MKHTFLIATILLCGVLTAHGIDITPNSVYRLKNNTGRYMSISGTLAVTAADDAADDKQEWYFTPDASGSGVYLRSVSSGAYLQSPLHTSSQWMLTFTTVPDDNSMLMAFKDYPDIAGRVVFSPKNHTDSYQYAHNDGSNHVVCWTYNNGSVNTTWILEPVAKTDEQLKAIREKFSKIADEIASAATYETHLDRLFTDKTCTALQSGISLSDNADFNALPLPLRKMALKIESGDWSETDVYQQTSTDWDDNHARKYRLQSYEPFSEGSSAAGLAGIWAYTNMNNPTGIVGDKGDLIYLMVEDEVKDGASLYIGEVPDCNMYNTVNSGTKLHKGLNIIVCTHDNSHFFIYYTVNTVGSGKVPQNPLAGYPPLKIHIEGGRINGFFNNIGDSLYEKDTLADFEYTVQRATHPMYDFLGRYVILHLHLFDTPSNPGESNQRCVKTAMFSDRKTGEGREHDPAKIMEAWDRMCFAELILMGILGNDDINDSYNKGYYESIVNDNYSKELSGTVYSVNPGFVYRDYFNNRMMGISQQGSLFMNASTWRTAYNVKTIEEILTQFCNGDIWGPAHEYGHVNQLPMKMAGTTEESNNIFSNVVTYYVGKVTSRSDFLSSQLKVFLDKGTFLEHGTWGTTRMFWQLWLYYHAAGHNKKFYPRLYELLRKHPLKITAGANAVHNEKDDMLHFAKMCCIAAEEDLTDFFTAWGFFVPLNNFTIDDYAIYNAVLTQEDIDAVKAEIKSLGFKRNEAIILIDDRPGNLDRESFSGFPKEKAGELGGLNDFIAGRAPSGNLSFTISGSNVNVTADGNPGIGYIIRDSDGELLGFANSNTFQLNAEVIAKLADGTASVTAIGTGGESVEVSNQILSGSISDKKAILKSILTQFQTQILKYIVSDNTHVGYIVSDSESQKLLTLASDAQNVIDDDNATSEQVSEYISTLLKLQLDVLYDASLSKIAIEDGASYMISNVGNAGFVLSTNDGSSVTVRTQHDAEIDFSNQWVMEYDRDIEGYTLRNFNSEYDNYIAAPDNSASSGSSVIMNEHKAAFSITPVEGKIGVFNILANGQGNMAITQTAQAETSYGNISNGVSAQWSLVKIHTPEYSELHTRLGEILNKAFVIISDFDYWDDKEYEFMNIFNLSEEARDVYKSSQSSEDDLSAQIEILEDLVAYTDALRNNSEIITVKSIGYSNDFLDDNTDTDVIRQAFNNSGDNIFEGIVSFSEPVDTDAIRVEITPVNGRSWAYSSVSDKFLDEEYEKAFAATAPESALTDEMRALGIDYVDGLFTSVEGRLETSTDSPSICNLVVNAPCSGVYSVRLLSDDARYAFFDSENKIPVFEITIYPNLSLNTAFNIEGYTFSESDKNEKTIVLPEDFIKDNELTACAAYIPGLYFVEELDVVSETAARAGQTVRLMTNGQRGNTLNADASRWYDTVDLGSLKNGAEDTKVTVYVSKNGADGIYSFTIKSGDDTTTALKSIYADENEEIYFTPQGIRVYNPDKGLYIHIKEGKAEKIIL